MENNQIYETSLREIIESILKKKKLIFIIVTLFLVATMVYVNFFADEVYRAESIIKLNESTSDVNLSSDASGIMDSIETDSGLYMEQILSSEVMQSVIDDQELDMTVESIRKIISINKIGDSDLIKITVQHTNRDLAASIANSVAEQFDNFTSDIQIQQIKKSTEVIEIQLEKEKEKLNKALENYKEVISSPRDSEAIAFEMNNYISSIESYKSKLSSLDSNYKTNKYYLEEAIRLSENRIDRYSHILNETHSKLVTKKSILDDAIGTQTALSATDSLRDLLGIEISNEEINPVYLSTLQLITDQEILIANNTTQIDFNESKYEFEKEYYTEEIAKLEKKIEELKLELTDRNSVESFAKSKLDNAQKNYDAFSDGLELVKIAATTKASETHVVLISKAITPSNPVSPKKGLSMAISLVLSVMISLFIVLFQAYWINSKTKGA